MPITKIYSTRNNNNEVYSDLIYEWENDYSKYLNIPIYSFNNQKNKYFRYFFRILQKLKCDTIFQKIESLRKPKSFTLSFELYPRNFFSFQVFTNKIPYIIDFDFNVELDVFQKTYKNCKLILISSLEAYNYLKSMNCKLNIAHLPLGISSKHKLNFDSIQKKEIDLIVVRSNKIFMEYLERYAIEFPDFEYVQRKWVGSELYKNNVYYSNKKGAIGEFSDRDSYLSLLKNSKVALYATPGFDEDNKRFMNHVTPSLFEFISAGCRIIARYPDNAETKYFNLESISKSINSYDDFKKILTSVINEKSDLYLNDSQVFLDKIATKVQAGKLQEIVNKLDMKI